MGHDPSSPRRGPLVCGVDDSRGARAAARVAARLADQLGRKLVLVHVSEAFVVHVREVGVLAGGRDAAAVMSERRNGTKGKHVLAALTAEEDLGPVEPRVECGIPAERLVAVAEDEGAELIVVGWHGRGALRTALFGSVSKEVIDHAPCPVLVVPPGAAAHA